MSINKLLNRFKIVLSGDPAVGKSSILSRLCTNTFSEKYNPTIGSDFMTCFMQYQETTVTANIWDFSGHPEYMEMRKTFYKHTNALVIIFDVTNLKSYTQLDLWLTEGRKLAGNEVPVWIVGNKIDNTEKRVISKATANSWAISKKCFGYFEVSAATDEGMVALFSDITIKLT